MSELLKYFGIVNEPIVGIDMGSSAIKVLEVEPTHDTYKVVSCAVEPLQPGAISEHKIVDADLVAKALMAATKKAKINSNRVCISLPATEVIMKKTQLYLPHGQQDALAEIEIDCEKYIPYDIDDVNIDFSVVGENEEDKDLSDVIIVAAKKENLETRVDICQIADLEVAIADVDIFASLRALSVTAKTLPDIENKILALFDIGATSMDLNVFKGEECIYNRHQAFGGQHLTDEIQNRYGLSYNEAVIARRFGDLPSDYNVEVLEPFKGTVAQQVSRACQLFFSSGDYSRIDYIFLTGGTCAIPGLEQLIQSRTDIKTIIAEPFVNMQYSKNIKQDILAQDAPALMTCFGLALRNCQMEKD